MALAWYSSQLSKLPLTTKCITAGCLSFAGDALCQQFEGKQKNLRRSAVFGAMGMFYIGPLLHCNYSIILPRIFPESALTSAYQIALKKLAFD